MNEAIAERVTAKGIVWADIEDCAEALMRLVSDDSINGKGHFYDFAKYVY